MCDAMMINCGNHLRGTREIHGISSFNSCRLQVFALEGGARSRMRTMRRKPGGPWNALFIALLATATPAFAADNAPVPEGFKTQPGATVAGVFARAISYGSYRGYSAVPDSVVAAEEACIARGRSLEYNGDTRRRNETTFWLYRSGTETVIFLSEDGHVCGRMGDRTLSKYRDAVSNLSGAACSTGLIGDSSLTERVAQDWLNEFERIQWMLRTSSRLRQLHGD